MWLSHSNLATRALAYSVLFFLVACGTRAAPNPGGTPQAGRLITAEDIRRTGASTAWEALKYTVRSHQFVDNKGQPARIFSDRGVGSMVLREEPLIFVDRARLSDIMLLGQMPAQNILYVRVLNGNDGTTYFGTSAVAGVILIETTMGADVAANQRPDTSSARLRSGGVMR